MLGYAGGNYNRICKRSTEVNRSNVGAFITPIDLIVDVIGRDIAAIQDHCEMINNPDFDDQDSYRQVVSEACVSSVMQIMTLVTGLHNERIVDWDHIRKRLIEVEL